MPKIELYTKDDCPFCHRAKALPKRYGVGFTEYDLIEQPEHAEDMHRRSNGGRTVPQIFIDDKLIGGFDALAAMDQSGELAARLHLQALR